MPALHTLLRDALPARDFSPDLLAEKLFHRPWPDEARMPVHLAVCADEIVGLFQSIVRPAIARAWVGLFAVARAWRRRGIATVLLRRARTEWSPEIEEVDVLGVPGNYFAPGVDASLGPASAFLSRAGFEHVRDCDNLVVELDRPFEASSGVASLREAGVTVRRAVRDDSDSLDGFFASHFGADWRCEASLALRHEPATLHLAIQDGGIVGFAAHSTQNREWGFFGPMGTAPAARRLGVGRVLLWLCLNDLLDAGHRRAVIPWVGPVDFYARAAGARVEQSFRRYRLRLQAPSAHEEGPFA